MDTAATGEAQRERLPILALLCANAISLLGSQVTLLAVPWFVLQTTGSATKTGFTGFFSLLPFMIGGAFGGVIVDRLGFRRTSILADLGCGAMIALVPLLHATIGLAYWQLLALVFLRGLIGTPGGTARQGLVPDLIALSAFGRERMNALFQGTTNLMSLLGAPLAGLLIVAFGPSNVLWLDAASFWASGLIVLAAVPRSRPASVAGTQRARGQGAGLRAGFDFIRRDRLLLAMVLSGTAINCFGAPFDGVILPVYASRILGGAVDLGAILAASGVGGLLGTILFGWLGPRLPRRALFVGAFLISAVPFWIYVGLPALLVAAAASCCCSLALAPLGPLLTTIMQERVPAELRGRVFGLLLTLILAAAPLGLLIGGFALDALGLRATLFATAVAYTAVVVGIAVHPALRGLDGSRPSAVDGDPWRPGTAGAELA